MSDSDYITITSEHQRFAEMLGCLVRVERQPSEANALFLDEGHIRIMTANGESFAEGPVWIIWDSSGYPYPITVEEFEKLYTRTDSL